MGLLTIIRKQKLKDREKRVLVLGLDSAGKSSIVRRIQHRDTGTLAPTMGFEIQTVAHNGYNVNMWDVGGQKTLRSFWFNYFDQLDALVWVVDLSSLQRLNEVYRELDTVLRNERVNGVKILVLLNKVDLIDASEVPAIEEQITEGLQLESYGVHNEKWLVLPCSAVTGRNITEGLDWLTDDSWV